MNEVHQLGIAKRVKGVSLGAFLNAKLIASCNSIFTQGLSQNQPHLLEGEI